MTFRYCKYVLFRASLIICIPTCISLQAQEQPSTGPVVEKFGPVYEVPDLGFPAPADRIYRVVFDIDSSPSDHETE
jgi:hypothetical protein